MGRRGALVTASFSVLLAGAAGLSWANGLTSSASGVIHACKQKNNGQVRIVSSPGDCRKSEIAVSWNDGRSWLARAAGSSRAAGACGAAGTCRHERVRRR